PAAAIERLAADINEFRKTQRLDKVLAVNVSSTEPPVSNAAQQLKWAELSKMLDTAAESPLPASSLYAIAAISSGCPYINFTPSIGSDLPALDELARERGVLHVGRDGKTGETLMKAVLAPMFA